MAPCFRLFGSDQTGRERVGIWPGMLIDANAGDDGLWSRSPASIEVKEPVLTPWFARTITHMLILKSSIKLWIFGGSISHNIPTVLWK